MSHARPDTKFIVILIDGAADFPLDSLGGKTPLEAANLPNMDEVARRGVAGLVDVIAPTQKAGSDVGNLTVLGYSADKYLTGRAPLEAGSMGVPIAPDEVAFRCNLVTLQDGNIEDYSAGHITSEEAAELIQAVQEELGAEKRTFYPGVQYRHLLIVSDEYGEAQCTPPHDVPGQPYETHFPKGAKSDDLIEWTKASWEVLEDHPVNVNRRKNGKLPATSIWLWGQGRAPKLPKYDEKYGLKGAAISAVDLVRGIAFYAGLRVIPVPGITGFLDTNYVGKAVYGLKSLDTDDFIYIHVEAPDEAAHMGDADAKIAALEAIDREIVSRSLQFLDANPNARIGILPDHITSVATKAHARGTVPFTACGVGIAPNDAMRYHESSAMASGLSFPVGHEWMDWFLGARN